MSVPTTTLLKQLAWEVEWLAGDTPCTWEHMQWARDHAEAALDIIEELEGREQDFLTLLPKAVLEEIKGLHDRIRELEGRDRDRLWNKNFIIADLRRLHDLIKGSASREAMELIRRMMGGDTGGDNV